MPVNTKKTPPKVLNFAARYYYYFNEFVNYYIFIPSIGLVPFLKIYSLFMA